MTTPAEPPGDWKEAVEDRFWAQWRWIVALVVLVFVLNNLVGLMVGGVGLIAFANRIVGRAIKAHRLAQQVHQIVAEPPEE